MTPWDKKNLQYLLSMYREECLEWFDSAPIHRQAYALGLLKIFQKQLIDREILLAVSNPELEVYDLSMAQAELEKFMLS